MYLQIRNAVGNWVVAAEAQEVEPAPSDDQPYVTVKGVFLNEHMEHISKMAFHAGAFIEARMTNGTDVSMSGKFEVSGFEKSSSGAFMMTLVKP